MTDNQSEVLAGYELRELYISRLSQELIEDDSKIPASEDDRDVQFSWDWRIPNLPDDLGLDQPDAPEAFWFDVAIGMRIGPSTEDPNRYETQLVGGFVGTLDNELPIHRFAHLNAVALLLPHLRQMVRTISGWSIGEDYSFPIVNVGRLMEGVSLKRSKGWKDLQKHPALSERLGISTEELKSASS